MSLRAAAKRRSSHPLRRYVAEFGRWSGKDVDFRMIEG